MKTRMKSTELFAHLPGESSDGQVATPKKRSKMMDEHVESHNRLHMLAAVASHHLHSDPTMKSYGGSNPPKTDTLTCFVGSHSPPDNGHLLSNKRKRASCKKIGEGDLLSLEQIRELSAHHLLKCFSDFDGNELKRTFTYSCVLDPARCQRKFSSFGSELKARQQMKLHLLEHVTKLSEEALMGNHFKAETVQSRQKRKVDSANLLSKKKKAALRPIGQPLKVSYMKEEVRQKVAPGSSRILGTNSATKDLKPELKVEECNGSGVRLARILREQSVKVERGIVLSGDTKGSSPLSGDTASVTQGVNSIKVEAGETSCCRASDFKEKMEDPAALLDHNYVLQGPGSTVAEVIKGQGLHGNKPQEWQCERNESLLKNAIKTGLEEKSKYTSAELNKFMVSETLHNMIMVCVLEEEKLQLKQLPCVGSEMDVKTGQSKDVAVKKALESESEEEPSREIKVIQNNIERDEYHLKKKPKGKAKFIGQSKAEKEMAIQMIEAIKSRVTSIESLECQICNPPRSFTAPTTLISHYRSHAGIKPYECRLCRSVFTRQHSLNYHMLIHSNQTRFTCSDCGRKFRHPSHFKEHRRRHTGESPYECSDCMYRFKTRNTYKRHMRTHHGKMLTPSGELLVLSDDEFKQARALPRHASGKTTARILGKGRSGDNPRPNTAQGGERSNGEYDEMDFASHESDSSDGNSDSNSQDDTSREADEHGEFKESNKENNGEMEVMDRLPHEGKSGTRKAFFKDIVKEAMRQSDIPFQGSDFRTCDEDIVIQDPLDFSVTEVIDTCSNPYFDELSIKTEDGDNITQSIKDEGINSRQKNARPILIKSEVPNGSVEDPVSCIYLNPDECVTLENQNMEVMCSTSFEGPTAEASKIEGTSSIQKVKSAMLLFKPMVMNQLGQAQNATVTTAAPQGSPTGTPGSFVSQPVSILTCHPVNGLLSEARPKESPAGKQIYIQTEGTLLGALKNQTLMLLNDEANSQISFCPVGEQNASMKNGVFSTKTAAQL